MKPRYKTLWRTRPRGGVAVVVREPQGSFYLRYSVPGQRRRRREVIPAATLDQAKAWARKRRDTLATGELMPAAASERVGIREAIAEAARRGGANRNRGQEHIDDVIRRGGYFLDWLDGRKRHWDEVNPRLVLDYVDHLAAGGKAPRTVRHYVATLTATARYWHQVDPARYREMVVVHKAMALGAAAKRFLSADDLRRCVATAHGQGNRLGLVGLLLGGFAGLRLREVCGIERRDFNADFGTIEIRQAKNAHSARVIPVLAEVAAVVASVFATQESPYLVSLLDGRRADNCRLGKAMARAIEAAGLQIEPKNAGRKTFVNIARKAAGVDPDAFERYIGHAPADITGKAYLEWGVGDLAEKVVNPLAAYLANPPKAAAVHDLQPQEVVHPAVHRGFCEAVEG